MLDGDASTVLGLLMHYPSMTSPTPILDYADMIKRYFDHYAVLLSLPFVLVLSTVT